MNPFFNDDRNFKKSSLSSSSNPKFCVSVAISPEKEVAVRDTKDPGKTTLFFSKEEWRAFIKGVKNSEFDLD